jgi:hypothetical protein
MITGPSGLHAQFISYNIDAITLRPILIPDHRLYSRSKNNTTASLASIVADGKINADGKNNEQKQKQQSKKTGKTKGAPSASGDKATVVLSAALLPAILEKLLLLSSNLHGKTHIYLHLNKNADVTGLPLIFSSFLLILHDMASFNYHGDYYMVSDNCFATS